MRTHVGEDGGGLTLSTPIVAAIGAAAGLLIGRVAPVWWLWVLVAVVFACWTWRVRRAHGPSAGVLACIAWLAATATWGVVYNDYMPENDLRRLLAEGSRLAQFEGIVRGEPYESRSVHGAFADSDYRGPVTLFVLEVDRALHNGAVMRDASGLLLIRVREQDHRIERGHRLRATGWLSPIGEPMNPGELNYREQFARQHIHAMLTLNTRDNWQLVERAGETSRTIDGVRRDLSDAAATSLRFGMIDPSPHVALLDAILLGRKSWELNELAGAFRQVGLAHVLAISGAHLAILVVMVWWTVRLFVTHPSRAACVVLTVLGMYLFALPMRTPIVRAGIMAAIFLVGYGFGRRWRGLDLLAIAAVAVLIWRPNDLFTPGFQLSFGIVGAMLLFTEPVAARLYQPMIAAGEDDTAASLTARWGASLLAANIVAFLTAMPLVAYHFQLVNPLAVLMTLLALPAVTAVLAMGYLKIIIGLVLPTAGAALAPVARWVTDVLLSLAESGGDWQLAAIRLPRQPSALWAVAMLLTVAVTLQAGRVASRWTLLTAWVLCIGWLVVDMQPPGRWAALVGERSAVRVNMYAVGDGSCYLLRIAPAEGRAGHVMMVDCGSQAYFDLALRSINPALRHQGVTRIDSLLVTHADIDHYNGVLDVVDAVEVGRVLAPPQLLAKARDEPWSVVGRLVDGLAERGLIVTPINRGWREQLGAATVEVLWPEADVSLEPSNDTSIVLSVRAVGRRVLLTGDIQQGAIAALLDTDENVRADITDLPHHGSFVDDLSPRWLAAVSPTIVLQSSGPARLYRDEWEPWIDEQRVTRLITDRHGMAEVRIDKDGRITWRTMRKPPSGSMD